MLLHQKVCETIGLTRVQLAEKFGISKTTIDSWSDTSRMSDMAKYTLELMLENHSKNMLILKINEVLSELKAFDFPNNSINTVGDNNDWQNLVLRMKYILKEYNLNCLEASKFLNEPSFDYLYNILNSKISPSFDFLNKFSSKFQISNDWLMNGKNHPFDLRFIKSNSLKYIDNEFSEFYKVYIVHCDDDLVYTKVVVEDKSNKFDFFCTDFCIGKNFIMKSTESSDIFDLYNFYLKHRSSISLVSLKRDEYDKLISRDFYAKNILNKGTFSFMLDDLFDLKFLNKETYGDFFAECTNIIKILKEKENNKQRS